MDIVAGSLRILGQRRPRLAQTIGWRLGLRRGHLSHRIVEAFVREGDHVVDVGANGGAFTHRFAQLVGPAGHVDAFEPNPGFVEHLRRLSRDRPTITLHPLALSDRNAEGILRIPSLEGVPAGELGTVERSGDHLDAFEEIAVPLRTLDEVISSSDRPVTFVKCDVEGHEDAVLDGALALLSRDRPVVLIEIEQRHRKTPVQRAFDCMAELGYEGWALGCAGLLPLERFDADLDQVPPGRADTPSRYGYVHDFLFVRRGSGVPSSLRATEWSQAASLRCRT